MGFHTIREQRYIFIRLWRRKSRVSVSVCTQNAQNDKKVPVMPFDNKIAVQQMESAYSTLLSRPVANPCAAGTNASCVTRSLALDGKEHPRVRIMCEAFFSATHPTAI